MSDIEKPLDLDALAALCEAATRAPWDANALRWLLRFGRKQSGPWDDADDCDPAKHLPDDDDADYIVAVHEALPALIERVRKAERERDALKADRESWIAESHSVRVRSMYLDVQLTNVTSERDEARAERDVLRLQIDDMLASAERVAEYDRKRNNNNGR